MPLLMKNSKIENFLWWMPSEVLSTEFANIPKIGEDLAIHKSKHFMIRFVKIFLANTEFQTQNDPFVSLIHQWFSKIIPKEKLLKRLQKKMEISQLLVMKNDEVELNTWKTILLM